MLNEKRIKDIHYRLNMMLRVLGILLTINIGYIFFFNGSIALPPEVLHAVSEAVPAIKCPMDLFKAYYGPKKRKDEIFRRTQKIYGIHGFTMVYGFYAGMLFFIWWLAMLLRMIFISQPLEIPPNSLSRFNRFMVGLGLATFMMVVGAWAIWYSPYQGYCKVAFDSYIMPRKPGVLLYALMMWVGVFCIAVSLYCYSMCILLLKPKEINHDLFR